MNFYVGQEVVCVNAATTSVLRMPLMKGKKYTIRGIYQEGDIIGFWLVELINKKGYFINNSIGAMIFIEPAYGSNRFASAESEVFAENLIKQLETEVETEVETLEWLHK